MYLVVIRPVSIVTAIITAAGSLANPRHIIENRVGGNSSDCGISDLSHHRAYRPVHGGSINLTSDTPFSVVVRHGNKPELLKTF